MVYDNKSIQRTMSFFGEGGEVVNENTNNLEHVYPILIFTKFTQISEVQNTT